jgi:hypothetical protein
MKVEHTNSCRALCSVYSVEHDLSLTIVYNPMGQFDPALETKVVPLAVLVLVVMNQVWVLVSENLSLAVLLA